MQSLQKTTKQSSSALLMLFSIAIAGMLYGYDIGIINGAFLFVTKSIPMSDSQLSDIAAAVLGGGSIATLIAGPLADLFGRRLMIQISSIVFVIGVVIVAMSHSYIELLAGRLVQGVAVGLVSIVTPLFLAESMPTHLRGRGIVSFQLLLTLGIAVSTASGLVFLSSGNWRGMFLTAMIPAILLFISSLFVKESPRWLALKGRYDEALKILTKISSEKDAKLEIAEMKENLNKEKETFFDLFLKIITQKKFLLPLITVCLIGILNQLTGINVILQFSATILKGSGLSSNVVALMGGTGIAVVNFLVTIIVFLVVDRFERKQLLAIGTLGIVISLAYCAIIYQLMPDTVLKGYLILIGLVGYIASFAFGPGALVWALLSELLPSQIRGTGMAVALFLNSGASAILASEFLPMVNSLGYGGAFGLFAAFTCLYFLLAIFLIPKTKGKSLEEIEMSYDNGNPILKEPVYQN